MIVPSGSSPVIAADGTITTDGTTDTVGYWQRVDSTGAFKGREGDRNVKWFGASANNSADNTPAFRLALASLIFTSGCIRIPAGQYAMAQKWMIDMANLAGGTVTIKGDGPGATILEYAMTDTYDSLIEVKNGYGLGSFSDLQINGGSGYAGLLSNPTALWVHDTTSFTVHNVKINKWITSTYGGGAFRGGKNNTNLTIAMCSATDGCGTQLRWDGGSGIVTGCNFTAGDRGPGSAWASGHAYAQGDYVTSGAQIYMARRAVTSTTAPASDTANWEVAVMNMPCRMVMFNAPSTTNSVKFCNNFYSGGGPFYSFRNCALTRSGSDFTITTPSAHGRIAGEYIKVTDASQAAFNKWWKIASVTSTTLTVSYTNALTSDTVTFGSLWACTYINGITESDSDFEFHNTGGSPGLGSIGVYIDGFSPGSVGAGEFAISNCICDYGSTAIFLHGLTNGAEGSSVARVSQVNCRPNGGPRDDFGCFRYEGVSEISATGCRAFPGDNNLPTVGTVQFNTFVISDGGQAHKTQDITITGGQATTKNSTFLYPTHPICAFVMEGANLHNVSIMNCAVDAAVTVLTLGSTSTGAAAHANGLTVMYADNSGRVKLIDSTGTHSL